MLPLLDANLTDPTRGGFGYLQDNGAGCFHPGIDLNAGAGAQGDCGADVTAIWDMELVASVEEATGFGLHQWWRLHGGDFDGHYMHLAHLEQVFHVAIGSVVRRGDVIATCGRSGGWEHCHLHLEVRKDAPPDWSFWPKGQRKALVAGAYVDPLEVCARYDRLAKASVAPAGDALPAPLREVLDATAYPIPEACRLITVAHGLGANADSIAAWVSEIGALRSEVARLEGLLAAGVVVAGEAQVDAGG